MLSSPLACPNLSVSGVAGLEVRRGRNRQLPNRKLVHVPSEGFGGFGVVLLEVMQLLLPMAQNFRRICQRHHTTHNLQLAKRRIERGRLGSW